MGSASNWVIAVVLCVFAAVLSNVGTNLQKLCWDSLAKEEKMNRPAFGSRQFFYWMGGLGFTILGSILDFTALGFGAQSVVAPLGSLTLVANVFIAPISESSVLFQNL